MMGRGALLAVAALCVMAGLGAASAEQHTTTTPIDEKTSLKSTTITLDIPYDNERVWGFVRGGPSEHVEDHPVIIQFIRGGEPVHVAQVDTAEDGSYEYKFRVRSTDLATGETIDVFSGKYVVKVFRVVPNHDSIA